MKTSKGKVLRINKKHVVVITSDGEFVKAALPKHNVMVGDIIEIPNKKSINYKGFKPYAAIASILIIVISLGLFNFFMIPTAYASVALDMTNTSIELTVDQQNKIIKAVAKSEQGEMILKDLDIEGMDIYSSVNLITNKSVNLGYFNPEEKNLAIATVIPLQDKKGQTNLDSERLMTTIHDEMFKHKYDGYVIVNEGNTEIMKRAHEKDLSVNKYMLQKKSQEYNINLPDQTIRNKSTTDIMKDYNLDMQKMSPDNWCEIYENNSGHPNDNNQINRWDMQPNVPNNAPNLEDNQNTPNNSNNMHNNPQNDWMNNNNNQWENHQNNWMNNNQWQNNGNQHMNDMWRNN